MTFFSHLTEILDTLAAASRLVVQEVSTHASEAGRGRVKGRGRAAAPGRRAGGTLGAGTEA